MKTALPSFILIALLLSLGKSNAQCTVSNIIVQNLKMIASTSTTCTIKFDETFNIQDNNGNKTIFIHGWLQNSYPNHFQCVNGYPGANGSIRAPKAPDLVNSIINIGLNNAGATPIIMTTYPPDATLPMTTMDSARKVVLPDGSANITLYGIVVTTPVSCTTPIVIVSDVWSSQSSSSQRAHCVNCGIRYSFGYLNVTGFIRCAPYGFVGSISNNTSIQIGGYYRVFADINGDAYFTPITDTLIQSNTPFTVGANASVNISGSIPVANINQNVFIVITQTSGAAADASRVIMYGAPQCSPLPVTFSSFTASRTSQTNVMLKWETSTEINNSGFAIQRNLSNNNWETINFITTQAPGGNSSSLLFYKFNDRNSNKGITQYRIKQVDIDGRTSFSGIRAVRGDGQKGKIIVFPNPSSTGNVNILFEDKDGIRDIILAEINGRTVKQWKGLASNTLQIENLGTGIYTLKVTIRETGTSSIERIIVF